MAVDGLGYTVWLHIPAFREDHSEMDERELRERLTRIENNQKVIQANITDVHRNLGDAIKRVLDTVERIEGEVRRLR